MLYSIGKALCLFIIHCFAKLEIENKDVLPPKNTPFIYASNHLSYFDPPILGVICPYRVYFLAKEELFKNKLFSFILRDVGAIPLKRGANDIRAVKTALKALRKGPLLIFPQGTRSKSYDQINQGVGLLYKKAQVPIVAARIYGSDKVFIKGKKIPHRGKMRVVLGRVTDIKKDDNYREIAAKVVEKIKSL